MNAEVALLGPAEVRALAKTLDVRPAKRLGQNFVHDANTVRRIVSVAALVADDVVLEVGPGLGSLTLALLPAVVVLHLLASLPGLAHGLVMVQAEVADRLAAGPGSRTYGVPSVKAAWYADVRRAGAVPRSVFWPVPNVDSALVAFARREPPVATVSRELVFSLVDAAFAQRRKTLRAALAGWAGSAASAEKLLAEAGVPAGARGEQLDVADFARLAAAAAQARA